MITLSAFRLDDVPLLMTFDRDPECARWFDFPPITMDEQAHHVHAAGVLERWSSEAANGAAYHFAVRLGDAAIGMVAIRRIGDATAGISYAIVLAHRGRGFATHAARLLIARTFGDLGFARIELRTDVDNIASHRGLGSRSCASTSKPTRSSNTSRSRAKPATSGCTS